MLVGSCPHSLRPCRKLGGHSRIATETRAGSLFARRIERSIKPSLSGRVDDAAAVPAEEIAPRPAQQLSWSLSTSRVPFFCDDGCEGLGKVTRVRLRALDISLASTSPSTMIEDFRGSANWMCADARWRAIMTGWLAFARTAASVLFEAFAGCLANLRNGF